jgi:hypothetical protein
MNKRCITTAIVIIFTLYAKETILGADDGYTNLITQDANKGAPSPEMFSQWVLDEINNDSLMRDQIKPDLTDIENNGHNSSELIQFYSPDRKYVSRLLFKKKDLAIKLIDSSKENGIYKYQITLRASDGFHGGYAIISFHFEFDAKIEYFKFTKAYMVTVVSYPSFTGKESKEYDHY